MLDRKLAIRPALPGDAEALAHLHVDSWRAAYNGLVPESHLAKLDYAKRTERFRELLLQSQAIGTATAHEGNRELRRVTRSNLSSDSDDNFLVEIGEETAGFLTVGACRDEELDPATSGEIWGIYLAPEFWRRGIGTALCQFGLKLLISRGYNQATLWVLKENAAARNFYEAMGFMVDGAERIYNLGAPMTGVRYRKVLIK